MFFFSHLSFIWDQPAKIRQHSWKERLRITLSFQFKSDLLKTIKTKIELRKVKEFYRHLYCGVVGGKFVPLTIQTSVRFCDFVEQFLRSP